MVYHRVLGSEGLSQGSFHLAFVSDLIAHHVCRQHKTGKGSDHNGWQNPDS